MLELSGFQASSTITNIAKQLECKRACGSGCWLLLSNFETVCKPYLWSPNYLPLSWRKFKKSSQKFVKVRMSNFVSRNPLLKCTQWWHYCGWFLRFVKNSETVIRFNNESKQDYKPTGDEALCSHRTSEFKLFSTQYLFTELSELCFCQSKNSIKVQDDIKVYRVWTSPVWSKLQGAGPYYL